MQFSFSRSDSVYTIYKSIQKCSRIHSHIQLTIEEGNDLFDNEWWGKQILEICNNKGIKLEGIVTGAQSKKYYKKLGIPFKLGDELNNAKKNRSAIRQNWRTFHTKTTYHTFLLLISEIILLFFVLRFIFFLLFPSTTIIITPSSYRENYAYNFGIYPHSASYEIDDRLTLMYYTGTETRTVSATVPISQEIIEQTNAQGEIRITNAGSRPFEGLIPQTQFITEEGVIFRSAERVPAIPPGGSRSVRVVASNRDINGNPIGEKANLNSGTRLNILKLPELNNIIYGEAIGDFQGGSIRLDGTVKEFDVDILYGELLSQIPELIEDFKPETARSDHLIIPNVSNATGFVLAEPKNFITDGGIDQSATRIQGQLSVDITYTYIRQRELAGVVKSYLARRWSPQASLLNIGYDRFEIFDIIPITNDIYNLGASFSTNVSYNFQEDPENLLPQIKMEIQSLPLDEAHDLIASYDQIKDVKITTTPEWYTTIPQLNSRIFITIENS